MRFVTRDDVSLHCLSSGDGPPLVLCHGLVFGSIASWYFSIAPELARRFRVIQYDQRGHGHSTLAPSGYDIPTLADDLGAVIDAHVEPDARAVLVGHSYGALVALHYALQHRHRVRALVLIDAPLPAARFVYPSIANLDSIEQLHAVLGGPGSVFAQSGRLARRARQRLEFLFMQSSLRADVAAAGDVDDTALNQLNLPVLCVYGRRSDCRAAGERLARTLPQARLRWLDCGHYIPQEMPAELLAALADFATFAAGPEPTIKEEVSP